MLFFVSGGGACLKVYFADRILALSLLFWSPFAKPIFPTSVFPACVLKYEVSFLKTEYSWALFIHSAILSFDWEV